MRFKMVGNKGDTGIVVIQNNDAALALKAGAPCFFVSNAATAIKGASAKTIEGLAAAEGAFFAGFNVNQSLNVGDYGESILYGFYDYARVLLATRSASSAVWLSYSAIALGDIMSFVTTSGVQAVQRSAAGSATVLGWNVIAAETLVSASSGSDSADRATAGVGNSTALVSRMRVFVRAL